MKIDNVRVYGLEESIIASGYAMLTDGFDASREIEEKDIKRAVKLGNTPSGSGHSNYTKTIIVQADITFEQAWLRQFLRYSFQTISSSSSIMHRITKMDLDSCMDAYVLDETKEIVRKLREEYLVNPTNENFNRLVMNVPLGTNLTMRVSIPYAQLHTMYMQRKTHKLESWGVFCKWIETLPMFKKIYGIE